MRDFEDMTFGMVIDYCTTYNNEHLNEDEKEDSIRIANQSDYDNF